MVSLIFLNLPVEPNRGYISEHSEAEFTHGICPDCARKLYPEYSPETIITKKK